MILGISQLRALRQKLKDKKIVMAGGTFDLMHRGHIETLKNLRKFGDVVVIAISSNARVKQRKGPKRPILSERERILCIDAVRYVDYTVLAPQPSAKKRVLSWRLLGKLHPDVFVSADKNWLKFQGEFDELGVTLKILPRNKINSTSRIIGKVLKRYCKIHIPRTALPYSDGVRKLLR